MGQTLSEPITAKQSSALQNQMLKVGSSSMQGWRISMEDAHTHILTLSEDKEAGFFAGLPAKYGDLPLSIVKNTFFSL